MFSGFFTIKRQHCNNKLMKYHRMIGASHATINATR